MTCLQPNLAAQLLSLIVHTFPHAATGTLLGGGGGLGTGGAIQTFVSDAEERRQLFEQVAYDCQLNQQPDEARELFMAAGRPRPALKIINQQLSSAIHANKGMCWSLLAAAKGCLIEQWCLRKAGTSMQQTDTFIASQCDTVMCMHLCSTVQPGCGTSHAYVNNKQ